VPGGLLGAHEVVQRCEAVGERLEEVSPTGTDVREAEAAIRRVARTG
jgi:hypothetical protein